MLHTISFAVCFVVVSLHLIQMEKNSHFIWELLSSIQFLIEYSSYIDASCRAILGDGDDDGGAAGCI